MKGWQACRSAMGVFLLAATVRADLILHYTFEPGTTPDDNGSQFIDTSSTQTNNGITSGGGDDATIDPVWDSERGNVEKVGNNKGIAVSNANGIDAPDNFSVSLWYKGTDTGYFFDQGSPRLVLNVNNNNTLNMYFNGSWYNTATGQPNDGQWHHIVYVVTNNGVDAVFSIYLDGVAQDVDTAAGIQTTRTMTGKGKASLTQQTTDYYQRFFMRYNGGTGYGCDGYYDDIRVYNTALTANEVADLYADTAPEGEKPYTVYKRTLSPFEFYRMRGVASAVGTAGAAVRNNVDMGQTNAPALTPAGGFPGFETVNSWAYFDGTDAADTLTSLVTNFNSTCGTVAYWVRMDGDGNSTQTGLFSRKNGGSSTFGTTGNDMIATFQRPNGSLGFRIDAAALDLASGRLSTNTWHYLVSTWERNTGSGDSVIRIYIDGTEAGAATNRSWDEFSIDEARFGKEIGGSGRQLKGSADELTIWTNSLTAAQILDLYQSAVDPDSEVLWSESFQDYTVGDLNGQNGWFTGDPVPRSEIDIVDSEYSGWGNYGGGWVYHNWGSETELYSQHPLSLDLRIVGTLTVEFSLRADNGRKGLLSLGYYDGSTYTAAWYVGTDESSNPNRVRVVANGIDYYATPVAGTPTNLRRMRFVINLSTGTGTCLYHDGTQWQSPASLKNLALGLRYDNSERDPRSWNAIRIQGDGGAAFDNLMISYNQPPPLGSTIIIR